jgi:hypothetical protein
MRNAYKTFFSENYPLARLRRRWEDNIKLDLKVIVCERLEWIKLTENRFQ